MNFDWEVKLIEFRLKIILFFQGHTSLGLRILNWLCCYLFVKFLSNVANEMRYLISWSWSSERTTLPQPFMNNMLAICFRIFCLNLVVFAWMLTFFQFLLELDTSVFQKEKKNVRLFKCWVCWHPSTYTWLPGSNNLYDFVSKFEISNLFTTRQKIKQCCNDHN